MREYKLLNILGREVISILADKRS